MNKKGRKWINTSTSPQQLLQKLSCAITLWHISDTVLIDAHWSVISRLLFHGWGGRVGGVIRGKCNKVQRDRWSWQMNADAGETWLNCPLTLLLHRWHWADKNICVNTVTLLKIKREFERHIRNTVFLLHGFTASSQILTGDLLMVQWFSGTRLENFRLWLVWGTCIILAWPRWMFHMFFHKFSIWTEAWSDDLMTNRLKSESETAQVR